MPSLSLWYMYNMSGILNGSIACGIQLRVPLPQEWVGVRWGACITHIWCTWNHTPCHIGLVLPGKIHVWTEWPYVDVFHYFCSIFPSMMHRRTASDTASTLFNRPSAELKKEGPSSSHSSRSATPLITSFLRPMTQETSPQAPPPPPTTLQLSPQQQSKQQPQASQQQPPQHQPTQVGQFCCCL